MGPLPVLLIVVIFFLVNSKRGNGRGKFWGLRGRFNLNVKRGSWQFPQGVGGQFKVLWAGGKKKPLTKKSPIWF